MTGLRAWVRPYDVGAPKEKSSPVRQVGSHHSPILSPSLEASPTTAAGTFLESNDFIIALTCKTCMSTNDSIARHRLCHDCCAVVVPSSSWPSPHAASCGESILITTEIRMARKYNHLLVALDVKPTMSSNCANVQSTFARKSKHFPAHPETTMSIPETPTCEYLSSLPQF